MHGATAVIIGAGRHRHAAIERRHLGKVVLGGREGHKFSRKIEHIHCIVHIRVDGVQYTRMHRM